MDRTPRILGLVISLRAGLFFFCGRRQIVSGIAPNYDLRSSPQVDLGQGRSLFRF